MLRFSGAFAVTVHDDGTLDQGVHALLSRHIPGCRIVTAAEADERADRLLGKGSFLHRWRTQDASYRRVIDSEIWSTSPKRIIMDSDVLVLQPPDEVLQWVSDGEAPFLTGQPPARGTAAPPGHVQTVFKEKLKDLSAALGLPARFLDGTTGAFYGCTTQLSLPSIERLIRCSLDLGIPMQQWGGEQCFIIYLLSAAGAARLDPDLYFNFFPHCVDKLSTARFVHFFGTYRFYENHYPRLASEIACQLAAAPARAAVPSC
jgi:hypothetical protein